MRTIEMRDVVSANIHTDLVEYKTNIKLGVLNDDKGEVEYFQFGDQFMTNPGQQTVTIYQHTGEKTNLVRLATFNSEISHIFDELKQLTAELLLGDDNVLHIPHPIKGLEEIHGFIQFSKFEPCGTFRLAA